MNITLLTYTPDPHSTVAAAARLCYSDAQIADLVEKFRHADTNAFLEKIMALGHYSVLEHVSFTFGVEGISRACSHQLVRHRIASFSQQSQRYVKARESFQRITPETIQARPALLSRFDTLMDEIAEVYQELVAAGVPAEDARFVLPNAAATKLVMTMNARELLHFFELRCCRRAQWEIRALAEAMLDLVKDVAPVVFAKAGAACLKGPCPEAEMSCGRPVAAKKA